VLDLGIAENHAKVDERTPGPAVTERRELIKRDGFTDMPVLSITPRQHNEHQWNQSCAT
jgi:hypothetical protein